MASPSQRRAVRALLVVALATFGLAVAAYLVAGYVVYDNVSRTGHPTVCRTSDVTPNHLVFKTDGVTTDLSRLDTTDYTDVRFASRTAGIQIAAWYMPGAPGAPGVVVTHGLGACRHDPGALVPAAMLHADGFGVLAIDLRDHGDSTIEDGRYAGGIEERADVLGARDWLIAQGTPPGRIGAFGTSMGAGAVLIAEAVEPDFAAVWEDSSYADTQTRIAEELDERSFPSWLAPVGPLMARLVAGDDLSSWSPLTAVEAFRDTSLFISHGADDRSTYVHHAQQLYDAAKVAGIDVEMWIMPGAGHTDAYWLVPDEYEQRLDEFFERTLR
jgi:dipeptidyl aminopeptidase/acylaminoacyl peptidase